MERPPPIPCGYNNKSFTGGNASKGWWEAEDDPSHHSPPLPQWFPSRMSHNYFQSLTESSSSPAAAAAHLSGNIPQSDTDPSHHSPLLQWFPSRMPHNYFRSLTESSSSLENDSLPAAADFSGSSIPHYDTSPYSFRGLSEIPRELPYSIPGMASASKLAYTSSSDMDAWNLKPHICTFNLNNPEVSSNERCLKSSGNQVGRSQFQDRAKSSWTMHSGEGVINDSNAHPRIKVAASVFVSESHKRASKQRKSFTIERQRRLRIAEKLKALQDLLPHSKSIQGNQLEIMDDVIEYIKYLQLQMKELSQSRLRGETCGTPLLFVETEQGYGHHFVPDQMSNEPLEEMMGKLMEENPCAATKLLASRGLYLGSYGFTNSL